MKILFIIVYIQSIFWTYMQMSKTKDIIKTFSFSSRTDSLGKAEQFLMQTWRFLGKFPGFLLKVIYTVKLVTFKQLFGRFTKPVLLDISQAIHIRGKTVVFLIIISGWRYVVFVVVIVFFALVIVVFALVNVVFDAVIFVCVFCYLLIVRMWV